MNQRVTDTVGGASSQFTGLCKRPDEAKKKKKTPYCHKNRETAPTRVCLFPKTERERSRKIFCQFVSASGRKRSSVQLESLLAPPSCDFRNNAVASRETSFCLKSPRSVAWRFSSLAPTDSEVQAPHSLGKIMFSIHYGRSEAPGLDCMPFIACNTLQTVI